MVVRAEPKAIPPAPQFTVDQAQALIRQHVQPISEWVSVDLAAALGRILATDVRADRDQPAFDRSMMDGVAIRLADCLGPDTILRGVGESPAGSPFTQPLQSGSYVRVMTGGVVPAGADAVVPVERLAYLDDDQIAGPIHILDTLRPEQHIARQGCEVRKGDVVLAAGTRIGPAQVGVLATVGMSQVTVVRRPLVALLPTGDELVAVHSVPGPGQVRDSNRWMLAALLQTFGVDVRHAAIGQDDRRSLANAIAGAAEGADVLMLSGGVSMGDYDFVGAALAELGAQVVLHRVRMRPGKPVLIAKLGACWVVGLPGNPVSSFVAAQLFARPLLSQLSGAAAEGWHALSVPTATVLSSNGERETYVPALLQQSAGQTIVAVQRTAGSADLAHFARGDVLVRRPIDAPACVVGDHAAVMVFGRC